MRLHELYEQQLTEYIVTGKPSTSGKDYVFINNEKELFISDQYLRDLEFTMSEKPLLAAINIVAKSGPEKDKYGAIEELLLQPAIQNKLGPAVLKSLKPNLPISPELFELFMNDITLESVSKKLASSIVYNCGIRTKQDAINALQNGVNMNARALIVSIWAPVSYVIVDHDNKMIYRDDKSAKVNSRMGTYDYRNKASYLLMRGDFSMDNSMYVRVVRQLVKMFPGYSTDAKDDKVLGAEKQKQQIIRGRGAITVYHGTSEAIWNQIQENGRMIPGKGPDYGDKIDGHSERMIYMTMDPDVARRYAIRASQAKKYVILEITVNDFTKLRFDEDSLNAALYHVSTSTRKADVALMKQMPDFATDSTYLRSLLTSVIEGGDNWAEWIREFPNRENVAKYLMSRALMYMNEYSFAYEGTIPLKNIKVYEISKTKRYNDNADYTQADYDELEQNAEKGRYPTPKKPRRKS